MSALVMNHVYRVESVMSRMNSTRTDAIRKQAADWQKQIVELNAKTTDTGFTVTLRSVLFEEGKSELKRGAASTLGKLVKFLNAHPDCTAAIEGHTDNTGSVESNFHLSTCRANSVKIYLVSQGIASSRIAACGNGDSAPIANNDCASGRQLNCRVEVIISNEATLVRQ